MDVILKKWEKGNCNSFISSFFLVICWIIYTFAHEILF